MSYESDLADELHRLEIALAETSGENFTAQMVRSQLTERRNELSQLLETARSRELEIRFVDPDAPSAHTLETSVLGALLTRFQTTMNYIVWALEAGPGVTGRIPVSIRRTAATEAIALAPGSFRVVLRSTELQVADSFGRGIQTLLDVSSFTGDINDDEEIEEQVADIGPQAVARLQKFFGRIAKEGLATSFVWRADGFREVFVEPYEAELIAEWLSDTVIKVTTTTIRGALRMADSDAMRFAIEDADGVRHEGRSEVDLSERTIDAIYDADVVLTTYQMRRTGALRERVSLLDLRAVAGGDD